MPYWLSSCFVLDRPRPRPLSTDLVYGAAHSGVVLAATVLVLALALAWRAVKRDWCLFRER